MICQVLLVDTELNEHVENKVTSDLAKTSEEDSNEVFLMQKFIKQSYMLRDLTTVISENLDCDDQKHTIRRVQSFTNIIYTCST